MRLRARDPSVMPSSRSCPRSLIVVVVQSVVVIAVQSGSESLFSELPRQPRASVAHTATPPTRNRQASSIHEHAQVPRRAGVEGCAEVHVGRARCACVSTIRQ
jgi:hypothetical protein